MAVSGFHTIRRSYLVCKEKQQSYIIFKYRYSPHILWKCNKFATFNVLNYYPVSAWTVVYVLIECEDRRTTQTSNVCFNEITGNQGTLSKINYTFARFKVAYNSGMFDNSHLLIMQYLSWNDLWKFSERLINPKEKMTKFEWTCAANFEVIRHLV